MEARKGPGTSQFSAESSDRLVVLRSGNQTKVESTTGVKQGCNLSPNLFNIFVNDLPDILDSICDPVLFSESKKNCLLYADDLLLMSNSENGLQQCLNDL